MMTVIHAINIDAYETPWRWVSGNNLASQHSFSWRVFQPQADVHLELSGAGALVSRVGTRTFRNAVKGTTKGLRCVQEAGQDWEFIENLSKVTRNRVSLSGLFRGLRRGCTRAILRRLTMKLGDQVIAGDQLTTGEILVDNFARHEIPESGSASP